MLTKNRTIFEELHEFGYFKNHYKAAEKFRNVSFFPEAIGFDGESDGFIALHRKHVDTALLEELPVCLILKKLGFGVLLLDEEGKRPPLTLKLRSDFLK